QEYRARGVVWLTSRSISDDVGVRIRSLQNLFERICSYLDGEPVAPIAVVVTRQEEAFVLGRGKTFDDVSPWSALGHDRIIDESTDRVQRFRAAICGQIPRAQDEIDAPILLQFELGKVGSKGIQCEVRVRLCSCGIHCTSEQATWRSGQSLDEVKIGDVEH